jgi:hypothetical protein
MRWRLDISWLQLLHVNINMEATYTEHLTLQVHIERFYKIGSDLPLYLGRTASYMYPYQTQAEESNQNIVWVGETTGFGG